MHSEIDEGNLEAVEDGSMILKTREMSWMSDSDLAKKPIVSKLTPQILVPSREIVPHLTSHQLDFYETA